MNFAMGLPFDNNCNTVFIHIDKLTKLTHLVPCAAGEGDLSAAVTEGLSIHCIV